MGFPYVSTNGFQPCDNGLLSCLRRRALFEVFGHAGKEDKVQSTAFSLPTRRAVHSARQDKEDRNTLSVIVRRMGKRVDDGCLAGSLLLGCRINISTDTD